MTLYIGREASKLWRRFCAETTTEMNLLAQNWMYILGGLLLQLVVMIKKEGNLLIVENKRYECLTIDYWDDLPKYVHGVAARGVHYIHRPGPTLQDTGFFLLPELGPQRHYISETVFTFIFLSFVLWTFHPFIFKRKHIYTVLIWCRVLALLCVSQFLRIITFFSTQLPGPNYHCREGSELATLPRPKGILEVFVIKFQGVVYGCGDLIFSSHMIFTLVFVITYHKYGTRRCIKQCAWLFAVVQSLLIIASRKHYTVDVIVAWYTVNLLVFFVEKKLPELPDRTASQLPISSKDKEGRHREETHNLLNGNSGDPADKRQRQQRNGKLPEDGNGSSVHDTTMNAS